MHVQVIHPFYVFQIASIILWSLDDYYYYAFCIALISAISIITTLVETKKVSELLVKGTMFQLDITDDHSYARNVKVFLSGDRVPRRKL